jgi:hypothetical protein
MIAINVFHAWCTDAMVCSVAGLQPGDTGQEEMDDDRAGRLGAFQVTFGLYSNVRRYD